jgi:hypothetical protein
MVALLQPPTRGVATFWIRKRRDQFVVNIKVHKTFCYETSEPFSLSSASARLPRNASTSVEVRALCSDLILAVLAPKAVGASQCSLTLHRPLRSQISMTISIAASGWIGRRDALIPVMPFEPFGSIQGSVAELEDLFHSVGDVGANCAAKSNKPSLGQQLLWPMILLWPISSSSFDMHEIDD